MGFLPPKFYNRQPDTHKGDYGYLFILGGSPGLTGAVCLAAQAALRIGAGMVLAGVPKSLHGIFEGKLTEVMSVPLADRKGFLSPEAFKKIKSLNKIDIFALGCGASPCPSTKKLIREIIKEIDKPLVVDADGINALAGSLDTLRKRRTKNLILTPHPGEFSRLIKLKKEVIERRRKELAREFAGKYNLTLVLKGEKTIVSDGKELFENSTGNPGMATAGMGDVLTGIISGLLAQGLSCYPAAKAGVYLHGLAGDFAAKEKTESCLIASDVIEYLPEAIKKSSSNITII